MIERGDTFEDRDEAPSAPGPVPPPSPGSATPQFDVSPRVWLAVGAVLLLLAVTAWISWWLGA